MTFIPLLLLATALSTSPSEFPGPLWVCPLEDGRTVQDAVDTGAVIRDRLPDAVILDDAAAVETLRAAGFRPGSALAIRPGSEVFLVRHHEEPGEPFTGGAAIAPGDVLWSRGASALIQTRNGESLDGALRETHRKRLSPGPLRWRTTDGATGGEATTPLRATSFDAEISSIVAAVDSAAFNPWILDLSGANPVTVGGSPLTFTTRYTRNSQCDDAEQYVYEAFQAMGFAQVEYDTFNVQSTVARNVIATLPGTETPEDIYILCGHLDSTSPIPNSAAPGANDNASGTAAVLLGAEILRNYQFRSTIKFIAFTGEEQGLYGSEHYAAAADAAGDNILGVVNCDMISWFGSRYRVDIEGEFFADAFMQVMKDACTTYTGLGSAKVYGAWGSDHVPFLDLGIPTFLAIESDYASYPCYHQTCDTASQNKVGFGVEVTRACLATIAHSAGILTTTAVEPVAVSPSRLQLQASPNPFRTGATLRFQLDRPERVQLTIHDVSGRAVRQLEDARLGSGPQLRAWNGTATDGTPLAAGVYYVRLQTASGERASLPVTLLR